MLTNQDFVHLHVHSDVGSNVRFKDSTAKVENIIKYASQIGNKGVALTEHDSLTSHILAVETLKELKESKQISQDFKVIFGNEIYLVKREDIEGKEKKFYHFLLLAKDEIGYRQIREISTRAWKDNLFTFKGLQRPHNYYEDLEEIIGEDKGHLIASTACLGGLCGTFSQKIDETQDEDLIEDYKDNIADFIDWCCDTFGENNFFLEMQPNTDESQMSYNKMLVNIAKAYNLKMIITTDVHFVSEEDRGTHKAFLTSSASDSHREVDTFYQTTRFFETQELYNYMDYLSSETLENAIKNTVDIFNSCDVGEINDYGLFKPIKLPTFPLPNKEQWFPVDIDLIKNYEYINNLYEDKFKEHTYLIHQIFRGMKEREIPLDDYREYFDRINIECRELVGITAKIGEPMGSYLTTMQKDLEVMREIALTAPGRGSASGELINYLLEITDVDPLRQEGMKLQHWRFLSAERPDYPDIDVDLPSHLKNQTFNKLKQYYESIGGTVIRIVTFKRETSKSAVRTTCRGLGINADESSLMSSLISITRGTVASISETYYGDKVKGIEPNKEFVNLVDSHKDINLLDHLLRIEGLVSGVSSHASGCLTLNDSITNYSSVMRTPSNELITSYDLHQIEKCGVIKVDLLLTSAMSLIQICLESLIKDGLVEWQGSLRETYKKYLMPTKLDFNDKELWDNIRQNNVMNLFQFGESMVGREALKKIQPSNLRELALANSLMRLMSDGESPMDKYVRFKNDPNAWDNEMKEHGLSDADRELLHKQLDGCLGVMGEQEDMMELYMNPKIGNMNIKEVNDIRKAVAKKKPKLLKKFEEYFYNRAKELGVSEELSKYCWEVETGYQKGYSFSSLHTCAYSMVALMEAWLYTKYPSIYWYYANLTVSTNTIDDADDEDTELDFEVSKKSINYGKIAKAIDDIMRQGVKITTPNINDSDDSFKPIASENTILYGLEGINSVNEEMVELIKNNRPYTSFMDFYNRIAIIKKENVNEETGKITKKCIVSNKAIEMLIKAGCFDDIEQDKTREEILLQFCSLLAKTKNKLTATDISFMEDNNIIPLDLHDELRIYNFSNFLRKEMPSYPHETSKNMKWIKIQEEDEEDTEYDKEFFYEFFAEDMEDGKDYFIDDKGIVNVLIGTKRKGSFEGIVQDKLVKLTDYMKTKEAINEVNTIKINEFKKPLFEGGFNRWEMQSISFYNNQHELESVNCDKYDIVNFFDLPEESEIESYGHFTVRKGEDAGKEVKYPIWKLSVIAGTVISKNNTKHIVTLLTKEGVVNVKFNEGNYSFWNKAISKDIWNEKKQCNEKKTIEKSFFQRGNLLICVGYRRGDTFVSKKYAKTRWKHAVKLITNIKDNGDIVTKNDRTRI